MESSSTASSRRRIHRRTIDIEGYLRDDGLLELEATLTDVKTLDYPLASGLRKAGEPIHQMHVRITVDDEFTIVDAQAESPWVPYPGTCEAIAPAYRRLIGLNLLRGFRRDVGALFAGIKGCTHLTELLYALPTAAIQTWATFKKREDEGDRKPFQLDGCHALDTTSSPAVAAYYPRWYRPRRQAQPCCEENG
ncbi:MULTISPECIES: DUF2889 domain-containing protein [Tepidiphilus]|uniref:DUF2889 domain-containing protein n=1 Tax=Tepidiphilus baoligensis TaxID=2698687 RepID=A0ABX1QKB3_9PROT|nr:MULTISPECIES: DUF2889 domain-containing protein [Tepidiphilus]NMH15765.1 DUF2889 domain-containing protein [Tepidiphilus baoligensis]